MANKTVFVTNSTQMPVTRHMRTLYRRFVLIPSMKVAVDLSVQRKRPRHRWEDDIKVDLQRVGCGGMDWINLAQDRDRRQELVIVVMNFWVLLNARNFLNS